MTAPETPSPGGAHPWNPALLEELAALPKGWNSHGSDPISNAALTTVRQFRLVPRAGGGLSVFYGSEEISIDIAADGRVENVYVEFGPWSHPTAPSDEPEGRSDA